MSSRSRSTAVVGATIALAFLAGCSAPSEGSYNEQFGGGETEPAEQLEAPGVAVEETPEPPEPAPAPAILVDSWTTSDGYQYDFALTTAAINPTVDIANAAPGRALIDWQLAVEGELTNRTPARNAPSPSIVLSPMWPTSSPICAEGVRPVAHAFSTNRDDLKGVWCSFSNAPFSLSSGAPTISVDQAVLVGSGFGFQLDVPEEMADSVVEALTGEIVWALGRSAGGDLLTDCLLENGHYMSVASAETGCGVK